MTTIIRNPSKLACRLLLDSTGGLPAYEFGYVSDVGQLIELWKIDSEAYDNCSLGFKTFQAWWEQYPRGSANVYLSGKILSSVGIYPVSQVQYLQFVSGTISESSLMPVGEGTCYEEPQHYWYLSGIVAHRSVRRSHYSPLPLLLSLALGSWGGRGHIAYPAKLFAMGYSPEGENMLRRFGFEQIAFSDRLPDGHPIYEHQIFSTTDIDILLKSRGLKA